MANTNNAALSGKRHAKNSAAASVLSNHAFWWICSRRHTIAADDSNKLPLSSLCAPGPCCARHACVQRGRPMSTYQELFRLLHKSSSPVSLCTQLMLVPRLKDNASIAAALATLKKAIRCNQQGRVLSAARTLLVLAGPAKAIEYMKRDAILRASSFEFDAPAIGQLVADWIEHASVYGLLPTAVSYLTSTTNLYRLVPAVRALYLGLRSRLQAERITILKCLLAEVDASFADPDPIDVGHGDGRLATSEELAEAFSYLLGQFHTHVGLTEMQFALTDPAAGYDPRYRTLLGDALKICRYREAEVLLEAFPYQAQATMGGVSIGSIDPALERSIRLGYVQHEMQLNVKQHLLQNARSEGQTYSLPILADCYFEQLSERVCRLQPHPLPRYVVELPLNGKMAELFSRDAALLEEVVNCSSLALEEYLPLADVPNQVVAGTITVMDLYKVQRLFRFLHHVLKRTIDCHEPFSERAGLYRASCLPILSREGILSVLCLAVGTTKASEVLTLLTANLAAPGLDIQDAPVIAAGKYFMVSPAVLASSNLPRNILSRLHKRLVPAAPDHLDPMQSQLAQALRDAGFLVVMEYHLKSSELETDVLAYRDGHLFIFECKNAYHPCNVYELRNTYNAMLKAADQLTLRERWLADSSHQRELFAKLNWAVPNFAVVHTCIALGNRVFNGYKCEGHPVRQVHELLNLILHGYIEFEDAHRVTLWRSETIVVADLVDYIQGSTTHADIAAAMVPINVETPIGDQWLRLITYALDFSQLKETVLARYRHS